MTEPLYIGTICVLSLMAVVSAAMAIWAQPLVGDDLYTRWGLMRQTPLEFLWSTYNGWSGRLVPFGLLTLAFASQGAMILFKALTLPCFLLLTACMCRLANGEKWFWRDSWLRWFLVSAMFWLGAPAISDVVVHMTGRAAYLWPVCGGLLFLCLMDDARKRMYDQPPMESRPVRSVISMLSGLLVGMTNEQVVAGIGGVLLVWFLQSRRSGTRRRLPLEFWVGVAGFSIGAAVLVLAPGNAVRLGEPQNVGTSLSSIIIRFGMYLGGAYFALGAGDAGKGFWLCVSIIVALGTFRPSRDSIERAAAWLFGSFAALFAMMPLVNYASPRTTFFPAALLFLSVLTLVPMEVSDPSGRLKIKLASLVVALLTLVDGIVGWAANTSLSRETELREAALVSAAGNGLRSAVVPYIATVPSRLTYSLNAVHDEEFVAKLAHLHGLDSVRFDDAPGAPRPGTLNPLKALKNAF